MTNFEHFRPFTHLTENEADSVKKQFVKHQAEALDHIPNELEKTPEDQRDIHLVEKYLSKEWQNLKLPGELKLDPSFYHFLDDEQMKKMFPGINLEQTSIFHLAMASRMGIFISESAFRTWPSGLGFIVLLHESIHAASYNSYVGISQETIVNRRTGYVNRAMFKPAHAHFEGFNEALTDLTVLDIIQKNHAKLVDQLKVDEKLLEETLSEESDILYWKYMKIVQTVIGKMAEATHQPSSTILETFIRGMFTGEMMHLRQIDRLFGHGSLRVLAAMRSGTTADVPEKESLAKILEYFTTDDIEKRFSIAQEVLNNRERAAYLNHREQSIRIWSEKDNPKPLRD